MKKNEHKVHQLTLCFTVIRKYHKHEIGNDAVIETQQNSLCRTSQRN